MGFIIALANLSIEPIQSLDLRLRRVVAHGIKLIFKRVLKVAFYQVSVLDMPSS